MSDIDDIRFALSYVDPQERDMWVKMGAALKDELGNDGFDVWDQWSQQSSNYQPRDTKDVWKSLKPGNVRIGSLFYEARQSGYKPNKPYTPPSAEELAKREREAQKRQQDEAVATQKAQEKAQRTANTIWRNNGQASPQHPYLVSKGITDPYIVAQLKQSQYKGSNNLLVPVMQDKEIVSMQFIDENGSKRFLSGGKAQGSYTFIGDTKRITEGVVLAEGVATAASIYQATGMPVVVAFNAGNLPAVAQKMVQTLPAATPVVIAADNDASQTGITKAREAAEIFGDRARVTMPVFTDEQQARYQQSHGPDALPSDFNDLHALAGIDAVRQVLQPEMAVQPEPEAEWPKPERSDWDDFPPVIRNGNMGDLKNEPEYVAAKGGDVVAAGQLVNKLINEETIGQIKQMIGDHQPYIVPVRAIESAGHNKIPLAMANAFGQELDLPIDHSIQQASKVSRTGSDINHRWAFQPTFTGEVEPGREYILMDDTLSIGSTIANLKGYIENRGGKVLGAAVMTAHEGALNIVIKPDMINAINRKHGDGMDKFWKEEFGYGIDKLTQGEAGHIRKAPNVDNIRDRITQARDEARFRVVATELPKGQSVQKEQPEINPMSEATNKVASVLSEPPPTQPTLSPAAEEAVFLRRQETNMANETTNSIELDDQRQQTIPVTEPKQPEPADSAPFANTTGTTKPSVEEPPPELKHPDHAKNSKPRPEQVPPADVPGHDKPTKPITDLQYKAPPEHLASRYIVANGQYLSANNGTTVLFEDQGKKISTAKTDSQTVNDMLEVAKAKGWDSIKLSGTKEFKAMMYVAAESQGIRTRGYAPTATDLALVERIRSENSLNSIEPAMPRPEQKRTPEVDTATLAMSPTSPANNAPAALAGERIVAHGAAPYQHDSKNQDSYYLT
ncbi:LPD7 domain-containing protein, partial [Snodgrassella sp. CFCC 13594]|uniref:LPD7 domain-containing protein n=1 Tax=Snodgrassella sp. CFCC 13594 TaxID=1775559 RepID=UPI000831290A